MNQNELDIVCQIIFYLYSTIEDQQKQILELRNKSRPEVYLLKNFMDVFISLSGEAKLDVEEKILIYELIKTGKFTEKEAEEYIKKAMQNGQIYERKAGWYQKA